MDPLRIIFMGTAELACASLAALIADPGFRVIAVVTQPDRPRGRDLKLTPSPVKKLALEKGLPVLQPEKARAPGFIGQLRELQPGLIVVAAYGQILPAAVLDLPGHGCLNVHTSLLPKYRGAAPIQWAILDGEPETGVTIMKMDPGLDTGDIVSREITAIEPSDDARTLHDRLARIGANLLERTIPGFVSGEIAPVKQPETGVSYARKITREDGQLDWALPARILWNRVRGLIPWPGTFTWHRPGDAARLLKIWRVEVVDEMFPVPGRVERVEKQGIVVACGSQALRILELQAEGGKRLTAQQFVAGHSLKPGDQLGNPPANRAE